jgi:hypothetical protein
MSCTITHQVIDGQNYTGDLSMDLTSASDGGAGYVAPECVPSTNGVRLGAVHGGSHGAAIGAHLAVSNSVPEPATSSLFVLALAVGLVSLCMRARSA